MSGHPVTLRHLLFVQKPEVLEQQRQTVQLVLAHALPDCEVHFAGAAEDVAPGTPMDAVIAPTLPWLPDLLARLQGVQWLHFLSAGVEKIWDMPFDKSAFVITKSSGVHGAPMSEYALGAMLYFAKGFDRFVMQSREARWQRAWLDELTGRRLVVLGLGHVGRIVAERARLFGMTVTGTLRHPRSIDGVERVCHVAAAGDLLAEADYVVVCLPLTDETRGVVDDALLARCKRGAVLVDISRGGVVQADALLRALDNGVLRGAALDVFEQQPLPADSPLWRRQDVLITPHVSGTTPHYLERALEIFVANANALLNGHPLVTPVDIQAGY